MSSVRTLIPLAVLSALALSACGSSTTAGTEQPSQAASPSVTTYHDVEVRLPVADDAVPGAPAGFVDALRSALKKEWDRYDDDPGCQQVPLFTVERVSDAGFAAVGYNDDPSRTNGKACQGAGGGDEQLWAVRDGAWTKVAEGQDVPDCSRLQAFGMPSSIVGHKCYDATTNKTVHYTHA